MFPSNFNSALLYQLDKKLFDVVFLIGICLLLAFKAHAQVNCNNEPVSPNGNYCSFELSPIIQCKIDQNNALSNPKKFKLEVLVEPDYEFCSQFQDKETMVSFIYEVFEIMTSEFFQPYFDLEVVPVDYFSWYPTDNDRYFYNGFSITSALNEYWINHVRQSICISRDCNVMLSGRKFGALGMALTPNPGINNNSLNICDSDEHRYRRDYAIASNFGNIPNARNIQTLAHELIHLFRVGHVDGILNNAFIPNQYPGCDPNAQCVDNCSMMCTQICGGNTVDWKNLECFMQSTIYHRLHSPASNSDCLLEDADPNFCPRCRIFTEYYRSRGDVLLGSCDGSANIVKLNFTVCNGNAECIGDYLDIGISTNNCSVELLNYDAPPGVQSPEYGPLNQAETVFGYKFDPIYFELEDCTDFEMTIKVNGCTNDLFAPSVFVNGTSYFNTYLPVKGINANVIGSSSTITYLSNLIANNTANFGQFNGTCDNGQSPYWLNLKILGTFVIDTDYKFMSSIFEMDENSKIIIEEGVKACFEEVTMYSCQGLWEGILAEENSSLLIWNSSISDAHNALTYEPSSYYSIYGNQFLNNYNGVLFQGTNSFNYPFLLGSFENNTFTSNRQLKDAYMLSGIEISNAFSGIRITDHLAEISIPESNQFSNLIYGIYGSNSNIFVDGATFSNIYAPFSLSPLGFSFKFSPSYGAAIFGDDHCFVKVFGSDLQNGMISDCQYGIVAHRSIVDVNFVSMNNVSTGISIHYTLGLNHKIRNSTFEFREKGVNLHFINPHKLEIIHNHFISLNGDSRAISIQDNLLMNPLSNKSIIRNFVALDEQSSGFYLNGAKDYLLAKNTFKYKESTASDHYGVFLMNAEDNDVKCNVYSTAPGTDDWDLEFISGTGIKIDHSPNNTYECEKFQVEYAFTINGACSNSKIKSNNSFGHLVGIGMTGQSMIGVQPLHGNSWVAHPIENPDFDAIFDTDDVDLIDGSRFEYANATFYRPRWKTLVSDYQNPGNAPWFDQTSGDDIVCDPQTCEQFVGTEFNGPWTSIDSILAVRDSTRLISLKEGTRWNASWQLFERIMGGYYDSIPPVGVAYKDTFKTGQTFLLYRALTHLRKAMQYDTLVQDIWVDKHRFAHELRTVDAAMAGMLDTTSVAYDSLIAVRTLLLDSLSDCTGVIHVSDSLDTYRTQAQLDSAAFRLSQHSDSSLPAENLRIALLSWHELLTEPGVPSSSCRADLDNVASQCPDEGGFGVYIARACIEAWGIYHIPPDICDPQTLINSNVAPPDPANDSRVLLELLPNPARAQVILRGAHGTIFDQVSVYHPTGTSVYNESMTLTNHHTLDINGWSPGIYIVMATHSVLSNVYYAKLLVVH